MTATIEDLDWVTFLGEDEDQDKCCENAVTGCSNQAVYVTKWGPDPKRPESGDQCRNTVLLCLHCYEFYTGPVVSGALISCSRCERETGKLFFKKIVYAEPVKR